MHQQVYHSSEIQAWEGRWFAQQNSAYGLMQQVAWSTTEHMLPLGLNSSRSKASQCVVVKATMQVMVT